MSFQTKVITDESQVPEGFVPMSRWERDKTNHKRLSDAHNDGRINAVKLIRFASEARVGKVWVHEQEAIRFLDALDSSRASQAKVESPKSHDAPGVCDYVSMVEHAADIRVALGRCVAYLGDIYDVLETVARATEATARAVEELATNPKNARHDVMQSSSGNGFHK